MSTNEKEALLIFCDAIDSAVTQLKQNLGAPTKKQEPAPQQFDLTKIKWTTTPGSPEKGPYERADDETNTEFQKLRDYLKAHKGKTTIEGKFYWLFTNEKAIGRKVPNRGAAQ